MPTASAISKLVDFIGGHQAIVVLTGAGISTESGIPDYRSPFIGLYAKDHKPITYQQFMKNDERRLRYWMRNFAGWPRFTSHTPTSMHHLLAEMDKHAVLGRGSQSARLTHRPINGIITQNVDGLHEKAGSSLVIPMHGQADLVQCSVCRSEMHREAVQDQMIERNQHLTLLMEALENEKENVRNVNSNDKEREREREREREVRPDGDRDLSEQLTALYDRSTKTPDNDNGSAIRDFFVEPECTACGNGPIKPMVVFFGENMPTVTRESIYAAIREADAVLVMGSSLVVPSGRRLVEYAHEHCNLPVAIVNAGETSCDNLATLKLSARLGDVVEPLRAAFATHSTEM